MKNFTFVPCQRNYERIYRSTQKSYKTIDDISKSTSDLVEDYHKMKIY